MQPATQSTGSVVYLVDGIIDSIQQQQVPESLSQLLLPQEKQLEKWVYILYA